MNRSPLPLQPPAQRPTHRPTQSPGQGPAEIALVPPPTSQSQSQSSSPATLQAQLDAAYEALASLAQELTDLRSSAEVTRLTQLLEANERLVLAVLHAQTQAQSTQSQFDELSHASQHDALTGAATRGLMQDRLQHEIAVAQRHGRRMAVLFLDLDDFKQINDCYGHAVGDEVLRHVATCLSALVRDSDTVSRHGGDEFIVLLTEVSQAADAGQIASKMLAGLAKPCQIGPLSLVLSASVGIAIYPEDGSDCATLIDHADSAMYRVKHEVKHQGRCGFHRAHYSDAGVTGSLGA